MKKLLLIGVLALVASCGTPGPTSPHLVAEKAIVEANDLYVAVATFANAQEQAGVWTTAQGEGVKTKAWNALQVARQAYALGQVVDLTVLQQMAAASGAKQ